MLALLIVLLLSSHVLPLVQSLTCDDSTNYLQSGQCCKKCEPGHRMVQRCKTTTSSDTLCQTCDDGYYMDVHNINFNCHDCRTCTDDHMKYEKDCTPTSDAVCTCDEGYRCSNSLCEKCVKVQTSPSPRPTFITPARVPHTHNNVWISVSLCFACVCVCVLFTCFLLISRLARPCGWIMSASTGFWSSEKSDSGSSQCTEEEVPMPVQEVCGKTEKLEDV